MRGSEELEGLFPDRHTQQYPTSAEASRLIAGVLGFDIVLNLGDRHALIVHLPRIKRDVLADIAARAMLILEAKQIVLVAEAGHASAKVGQLFENFRNVLRHLVGGSCLLVREQCWR